MKIVISNSYNGPIYMQIKNQIFEAILAQELLPGDALPSLRALAKDLKIGVLTVNRAYTELESEGYIENIQGKGCFVALRSATLMKQHLVEGAKQKMSDAIAEAAKVGISEEEMLELFQQCLKEARQ